MDALIRLTGGAPAAGLVFAAMIAASVAGLWFVPGLVERSLFRPYWFVRKGQWATPVTSAFTHADLPHLVFNAFTFWAFAFGLERRIGTPTFVALYAVGIAASDLVSWLRHRHELQYATLGASGAILAVLFANILYLPDSSIYVLPIPFPIPAPVFALGYLAYSVFASHRGGGRVNHDAHLGGAAAGLMFVALTDGPAFERAWAHWLGAT